MYGTLRWDKSIIGHAGAALAITALAVVAVWLLGLSGLFVWPLENGALLGSLIGLCFFWGREVRDCETGWHDDKGNKLKSGDLRALYLMWIRWQNLLDMLGPIVIHLLAWAFYLGWLSWPM